MRTPTHILDIATRATQKQLGSLTKAAFFLRDGLQRTVVDGLFNLLIPRTWTPTHMLKIVKEAASESIHLSRFLVPGELGRLVWQEVRNKLEVFVLMQNLPDILRLRSGKYIPLSVLVEKAYSLPGFDALWAVEGVGHYYADVYWERKGAPTGLLSAEHEANVPVKSLLMLHAGMGLCFADRLLKDLASRPSVDSTRAKLKTFVSLCRDNSLPGYFGAAVESLGLVARDFYPELVPTIDHHLQEVAPELVAFFWHGVGRALYFSRAYFLPILRTPWSSIGRESSHEVGRINAMAGLAWAFTLVNMRQPRIMENLLRSSIECTFVERTARGDAFKNGVASSIIMRTETTPNETLVMDFYEHPPDSADNTAVAVWDTWISRPSHTALEKLHPALKQHQRLDQVFRCRTLPTLPDELENRERQRQVV